MEQLDQAVQRPALRYVDDGGDVKVTRREGISAFSVQTEFFEDNRCDRANTLQYHVLQNTILAVQHEGTAHVPAAKEQREDRLMMRMMWVLGTKLGDQGVFAPEQFDQIIDKALYDECFVQIPNRVNVNP